MVTRTYVIIVAAGTGTRFGGNMPKQFMQLAGKPVLCHTIDAIRGAIPTSEILLVLSEQGREIWHELCDEYGYDSPRIVLGGDTRSQSVNNALVLIDDADAAVLIHDGARPLVSCGLIQRVAEVISRPEIEGVVPVIPLTNALAARCPDGTVLPVDRSAYCAVQTPQAFRAGLLKDAYSKADGEAMADDAAIFSTYAQRPIASVEGEINNIKITNAIDLKIAEITLANFQF